MALVWFHDHSINVAGIIYTQELDAIDHLHISTINADWCMYSILLPEIDDHLLFCYDCNMGFCLNAMLSSPSPSRTLLRSSTVWLCHQASNLSMALEQNLVAAPLCVKEVS